MKFLFKVKECLLTDKEKFVQNLLSRLPIADYCLFIVQENEKFSEKSSDQKNEELEKFKSMPKFPNFQNSIKNQWRKYFTAAYDCGLFRIKFNKEILSRILRLNDGLKNANSNDMTNDFRGALSVCCACYVLYENFGFKVEPLLIHKKNKRSYDLDVYKDNIHLKVEVKAPERELQHPPGQVFHGDDAEQLRARILEAVKQGADFVCIVNNFTTQIGKHSIYGDRERLINAVCTNYRYPKFLTDFSNVKAILTIEQKLEIIGDGNYDHSLAILLMENPIYYNEIAPIFSSGCVHLIKDGEKWLWSDGKKFGL